MPATETDKIIIKYARYKIGQLSQNTIRTHVVETKQALKYLDKPIVGVTSEDINKWIKWLFLNNYSKSEIRTKSSAIQSFFKWCLSQKIIFDNPCVDISSFKSLYTKYSTEGIEYIEQ